MNELLRQDAEDESNRLKPFDGYHRNPPRPRQGPGLQLRPQHDDINEYFTGPKWDDPRGIHRSPPYLDVAEAHPVPPPEIVSNRQPVVLRKFSAKNILFHGYPYDDWLMGAPARFRGSSFVRDIQEVADILRDNPDVKVKIRASVGSDGRYESRADEKTRRRWIRDTRIRRARAVANRLKAEGIDPARISTELGYVGTRQEDRKVEFFFDPPAVWRPPDTR